MANAAQVSTGHAAGLSPWSAIGSRRAGAVAGLGAAGRFRRAGRLTRSAAGEAVGGGAAGGRTAWAKILANPRGRAGGAHRAGVPVPRKRNGGETNGLAASGREERERNPARPSADDARGETAPATTCCSVTARPAASSRTPSTRAERHGSS